MDEWDERDKSTAGIGFILCIHVENVFSGRACEPQLAKAQSLNSGLNMDEQDEQDKKTALLL
ncbi:MAG TPA: hypothetical protein VGM81_20895 [Burkholderiaceae bacterium]|jgi:hypothetical protein